MCIRDRGPHVADEMPPPPVEEDGGQEGKGIYRGEPPTQGPKRIGVSGGDHPIVHEQALQGLRGKGGLQQEDDAVYEDEEPRYKGALPVGYVILDGEHLGNANLGKKSRQGMQGPPPPLAGDHSHPAPQGMARLPSAPVKE